jgi:predicted amidohydrolase YtcJ
MKKRFFFLAIIALVACHSKKHADTIYYNGVVYTVNDSSTVAESFAVADGKIVAVGDYVTIASDYKADKDIDLLGKAVYPGFIDAHCHFYGYSMDLQKVNLEGAKSYKEVVERILAHSKAHPSEWILGRGWDQNDWDIKEYPNKAVLDSLFPHRPVFMERIDGHAVLVNQEALNRANVTAKTKINGGSVELVNGKLVGVLVDNAVDLVSKIIPKSNNKQISESLQAGQSNCFAMGLTTVDDAGLDKNVVDLMDSLQKANVLKMRVYAMLNPTAENKNYYFKHGKYKTDRLNVCAFKIYADGALGSRGACMLKPYSDKPKQQGFLLQPYAYYTAVAKELYDNGFQMNTHCIGDSSNRFILNTYATVLKGKNDRRWRIEHAQVVSPQDINKFGQNSIIPSVQPTHATSDMYWAQDRIGNERIKGAYAYKQLLEQNGYIADGSDFPVENINPLYGFYAAVVRKDKKNFPANGFQTENAISREQALRAMTIWAAYSNFEEKEKGSIEVGKKADFVILEDDIMKAAPEKLHAIKVLKTFIAGEMVFCWK